MFFEYLSCILGGFWMGLTAGVEQIGIAPGIRDQRSEKACRLRFVAPILPAKDAGRMGQPTLMGAPLAYCTVRVIVFVTVSVLPDLPVTVME